MALFPEESPQGPSDLTLPFPSPQPPHLQRETWPMPGDPDNLSWPSVQEVRKDRWERKGSPEIVLRANLPWERLCSLLIKEGKGASLGPQSRPRRDALQSSSLSQGCL